MIGGDEWQFDHEDITEAIEEGSKWSINGNGVGYPKAMEYRHGTPVTNLAFEGVAGINWVFEYPILKEGVYDYKVRVELCSSRMCQLLTYIRQGETQDLLGSYGTSRIFIQPYSVAW